MTMIYSLVRQATSIIVTAAICAGPAPAQDMLPLTGVDKPLTRSTGIKPERLISDDQIRSAISKITGVSDLEAERKDAPESKWFSRDRADIDAEISEHLDELSKTLGSSDAVRAWREMRDRQRQLGAKRVEVDKLVQEAELSPSRRDELRQKIEAARHEADTLQERVSIAKRTAKDHLGKAGLDLTEAQLDALSANVVSDDIVDMVTRVTNLATVLERLSEAVTNGTNAAETQRRYYGAVVVVQKLMLGIQQRYHDRIERKYLPFVDDVVASTIRANDEASRLRRSETNAERIKALDGNLKAQKITLQAARLYRQQLEGQKASTRDAIAESQRTLSVAVNTRDTVNVSLDLLTTMDASQQLFGMIQGMRLPAIVPINSDELRSAFERLTAAMQGS
jgi:hypothetical protein